MNKTFYYDTLYPFADMAVQKFKTFTAAEKALWNFKPDDRYYKQVRQFFQLAARFYQPRTQKGIQKFHTIKDAQNGWWAGKGRVDCRNFAHNLSPNPAINHEDLEKSYYKL